MSPRIVFLAVCGWLCLSAVGSAQEASETPAQAAAPSASAIETLKSAVIPNDPQGLANLKSVVAWYVGDGKFDELIAYLTSLLKKGFERLPDVYFYRAYARQAQLDYWKKIKNWEGVYDKGSEFKASMEADLAQAEKFTKARPDMALRIAMLRWLIASQDDAEAAPGLFDDVVSKAKSAASQPDTMILIKDTADSLSSYEDKNLSRRLYEVYASALKASGPAPEQLKKAGQDFVQQKNIYLAKTLFEGYLEQFAGDSDVLAKETVLIADKFADHGRQEALDPVYAEGLYQKAFDLAGQKAFSAVSQYNRAFNLERMKDAEAAIREYGKILSDYPDFSDRAEVEFRVGVLRAYAVRDIQGAVASFEHIKTAYPQGRISLSSLYQLGLLSQWESKNDAAKAYYEALMTSAQAQGADMEKDELVLLSRERLQEIEEKKPMKYGLRLFFEGIFGASRDVQASDMPLSVDVTGRPAKAAVSNDVVFTVTTSNPVTGCMMPDYSYEWSGETGTAANIPNSATWTTSYGTQGIKVIHVAVVGNNGLEGVGFEMIQIEKSTSA
jgi:tetratricopeptide (TPR) repeat protein